MDESNKLRRALKSPIVMIGLCVLAGWAMYSNLMGSLPETSISTSLTLNQRDSPPTSASSRLPLTVDKDKAVTWIDHPDRDPFSPTRVVSSTRTEPSSWTAQRDPKTPIRSENQQRNQLVLKAVAVEDQYRSAVINRTVVQEGETIQGYQVMSIQPKGVWLKHQGKTQFLSFAENTSS
ncbi:MAG: hypothetical protein V3T42_03615 [Nitrospirales bacterium]